MRATLVGNKDNFESFSPIETHTPWLSFKMSCLESGSESVVTEDQNAAGSKTAITLIVRRDELSWVALAPKPSAKNLIPPAKKHIPSTSTGTQRLDRLCCGVFMAHIQVHQKHFYEPERGTRRNLLHFRTISIPARSQSHFLRRAYRQEPVSWCKREYEYQYHHNYDNYDKCVSGPCMTHMADLYLRRTNP